MIINQNSSKSCHTRRSSNKPGREPISSREAFWISRADMKNDTASTSTGTNSKVSIISSHHILKSRYCTSHISNSLEGNWQKVFIKSISHSWKLNIKYKFSLLWQTLKMSPKFARFTPKWSCKTTKIFRLSRSKHKIDFFVGNSVRWPIKSRARFQGPTMSYITQAMSFSYGTIW